MRPSCSPGRQSDKERIEAGRRGSGLRSGFFRQNSALSRQGVKRQAELGRSKITQPVRHEAVYKGKMIDPVGSVTALVEVLYLAKLDGTVQ